mmetsp:Transcript_28779/g.61783  ORF Transcript_28779/g.61783 Transcript_28779/m.61783 type:complete len:224 (+) Transcript_28779:663-1334(+)
MRFPDTGVEILQGIHLFHGRHVSSAEDFIELAGQLGLDLRIGRHVEIEPAHDVGRGIYTGHQEGCRDLGDLVGVEFPPIDEAFHVGRIQKLGRNDLVALESLLFRAGKAGLDGRHGTPVATTAVAIGRRRCRPSFRVLLQTPLPHFHRAFDAFVASVAAKFECLVHIHDEFLVPIRLKDLLQRIRNELAGDLECVPGRFNKFHIAGHRFRGVGCPWRFPVQNR